MADTMSREEFMARRPRRGMKDGTLVRLVMALEVGGPAMNVSAVSTAQTIKSVQTGVAHAALRMGIKVTTAIIDGEVWAVRLPDEASK